MREPLLIWVVHQLAFAWDVPGQHGGGPKFSGSPSGCELNHIAGTQGRVAEGGEHDVQTSTQPLR